MGLITLKEYAERMGKPRNTVYRKYQNGYLHGVKIGRDVFIDENEPYIDARVTTGKYIGFSAKYRKSTRKEG